MRKSHSIDFNIYRVHKSRPLQVQLVDNSFISSNIHEYYLPMAFFSTELHMTSKINLQWFGPDR